MPPGRKFRTFSKVRKPLSFRSCVPRENLRGVFLFKISPRRHRRTEGGSRRLRRQGAGVGHSADDKMQPPEPKCKQHGQVGGEHLLARRPCCRSSLTTHVYFQNMFVLLLIYLLDKVKCDDASSESLRLLDEMTPALHDLNQFSPDNNGRAVLVVIDEKREQFVKLLKKQGRSRVPFPELDVVSKFPLHLLFRRPGEVVHCFLISFFSAAPAAVAAGAVLGVRFLPSCHHSRSRIRSSNIFQRRSYLLSAWLFSNIPLSTLFFSLLQCKIKNLKDVFMGLYLCEVSRAVSSLPVQLFVILVFSFSFLTKWLM